MGPAVGCGCCRGGSVAVGGAGCRWGWLVVGLVVGGAGCKVGMVVRWGCL